MHSPYTLLTQPLTSKDCDAKGWVRGVIPLDLSDLIDNDLEGVLDLMSERLTGGPLLSDISYRVRGHDGNTLHIEVEGDAGMAFDREDDAEG
jgi:hypothetical protein